MKYKSKYSDEIIEAFQYRDFFIDKEDNPDWINTAIKDKRICYDYFNGTMEIISHNGDIYILPYLYYVVKHKDGYVYPCPSSLLYSFYDEIK